MRKSKRWAQFVWDYVGNIFWKNIFCCMKLIFFLMYDQVLCMCEFKDLCVLDICALMGYHSFILSHVFLGIGNGEPRVWKQFAHLWNLTINECPLYGRKKIIFHNIYLSYIHTYNGCSLSLGVIICMGAKFDIEYHF